ncbi:MAG: hydrolase [Peptostreptococcales bacterium]
MKIKREDCVLVAVDFQERLLPVIKGNEQLEDTVCKLIEGCKVFNVPILVTQQYTKGIGRTTEKIAKAIGDFDPIEKITFSACDEPEFCRLLEETGKKTVLLTGTEAHICVLQTGLDLLERGYKVYLVMDCIGSRDNNDKKYAGRRMSEAGAIGVTYESVLFELCHIAGTPEFKQISKIVK